MAAPLLLILNYLLMPLSLGAGMAIAGGASLLGSLLNTGSQRSANNANLQAVRETNQANLELYNKQFSDQMKLWNMNNAYNDPSAQMSRLRAAGLNPTLNMGNNPTGSAEMASAPSPIPMQAGHVEPVRWNFSDVANSLAMMASASKSHQEAVGQQIGNQYIAQEKIQGIAKSIAETRLALQNVRKGSAEEAYLRAQEAYRMKEYQLFSETYNERKQSFDLDNQYKMAQTAMVKEQTTNFAADTAYKKSLEALNITRNQYEARILQATIDELISRASLNYANVNLSNRQAYYYYESTFETIARKKGLHLDNMQKAQIMPFIVEGAQLANKSAALSMDKTAFGMFMSPFEQGKNLVTSMGLGLGAMYGKGKIQRGAEQYWWPTGTSTR